MSAIFLSYRRDDSSVYAGRLFDNLAGRFGRERVFMDIETLEPGMDFVAGIDRAIESCGAVIAMIGPSWIKAKNGEGRLSGSIGERPDRRALLSCERCHVGRAAGTLGRAIDDKELLFHDQAVGDDCLRATLTVTNSFSCRNEGLKKSIAVRYPGVFADVCT